MLQRGMFTVTAIVKGVEFKEDYELPYRTEEDNGLFSTLYQSAQYKVAQDSGWFKGVTPAAVKEKYEMSIKLGLRLVGIDIISINRLHNHLIVD